jgi:hypothetical protein
VLQQFTVRFEPLTLFATLQWVVQFLTQGNCWIERSTFIRDCDGDGDDKVEGQQSRSHVAQLLTHAGFTYF